MSKEEYEVIYDEDERPATKSRHLMCRMYGMRWGSKEGEELREKIQGLHDNRKEWQKPLLEFVGRKISIKQRNDIPYAINNMADPKALKVLVDEFIEKIDLNLGEPAQQSLVEGAKE